LSSHQCPFQSNGSEFSKNLLKALMFVYILRRLHQLSSLAEISWGKVLVGESLVKQDDPCRGIAKLFGEDISRKEASMA
jgi:hypothetical protein